MRLEFLLIELLQVDYSMPLRLNEEWTLHVHECLYKCLHNFQHYNAYKKTNIPYTGR